MKIESNEMREEILAILAKYKPAMDAVREMDAQIRAVVTKYTTKEEEVQS